MKDSVIKDSWNIILRKNIKLLNDFRLPLVKLEECLAHFRLPTLPPFEINMNIESKVGSIDPSFKNLTEEILINLRYHIYTQTDLDDVAIWAEKLMRFCEVRYSTLKKRSADKWQNKATLRLNWLHISAFFIDYCIFTRDIRFLNTVLKLLDSNWILNKRTIKNKLEKENNVSDLFQFRILLMTEYLINQLYKETWYE